MNGQTDVETDQDKPLSTTPVEKQDECMELKNIKYKTMLMNGTSMKETKTSSDMDNLERFLETEKIHNKAEPWCKLDKTVKIQKLLVYVEEYKDKNELTDGDKSSMLRFLKECLSKKRLNRVKDVVYDRETGTIKEIPALIFNKQTKHFTLKNVDKRVSTLKSLPPKKSKSNMNIKTSKKNDSLRSIDSDENLDD